MKIFTTLLCLGSFSLLFCATPIGFFKTVNGSVHVLHADKTKAQVKSGEQFFEQDIVQTGPDGSAGMIFNDDTLISVGSKSEFAVKEYLFEPSEKKVAFSSEITKGTMACVTGLIAKINPQSMKIKAKTATIGIRGTYFVVDAGE